MQHRRDCERPSSPPRSCGSTHRIESMHDVFSDPYRCGVLYYLQDCDDPVPADEVIERVLAWSPDEDATDGPDRTRTWFLTEHVRKLDEFGLIERDREAGTLRLSGDVSLTVAPPWAEPESG